MLIKNLMFSGQASHKDISKHSVYERPFNPKFGSQVRGLLFELIDEQTARILATTLQLAIENFEPRAKVEEVICRPNFDLNSYDVEIRFYVTGIRELQGLELVLERLR